MDTKKLGDAMGEAFTKALTETFLPEMRKSIKEAVKEALQENSPASVSGVARTDIPRRKTIKQIVLESVPTDRFTDANEILGIVRADSGDNIRETTVRMYLSTLARKDGLLENRWGKGYRRI